MQHDLVKAKHDLRKTQRELESTLDSIESKKKEEADIERQIENKRSRLKNLDEYFAYSIQWFQKKAGGYLERISTLHKKGKYLSDFVESLSGSVNVSKNNLKEIVEEYEHRQAELLKETNSLQEDIRVLIKKREESAISAKKMAQKEQEKRKKLDMLNSKILESLDYLSFLASTQEKANDKNAKLGREKVRLEKEIESLKKLVTTYLNAFNK